MKTFEIKSSKTGEVIDVRALNEINPDFRFAQCELDLLDKLGVGNSTSHHAGYVVVRVS